MMPGYPHAKKEGVTTVTISPAKHDGIVATEKAIIKTGHPNDVKFYFDRGYKRRGKIIIAPKDNVPIVLPEPEDKP